MKFILYFRFYISNFMKITIAIPVYNSETTIGELVEKLILNLSKYNLEIILVNDSSHDNSEKKCLELYDKYSQIVKYYALSKNVGEHNAVMAALNQATGDFAIIMDDDFQNPISEVKKLIDFSLNNDFDVIYTYYSKKKHSFFRNLGSKFNDKIANVMLQKPKKLYLSSFKSVSKFIILEVIKYDLPYPYVDGLILRTTDNIGKIQVEHSERQTGKSQYTLKKLFSLWMNMFTNFSILPLRLATILGFVFSIISFLLGVAGVFMKFSDPSIPMGYASLFVTVSIFAGIQLIAIGMVGEYIGRIFISMNKKPQYSIKKSKNKL